MNYFNESTADMTGDELHRKLFPIDKLPTIDYSPVTRKIRVPKEEFRLQNSLKRNDIEIEVV